MPATPKNNKEPSSGQQKVEIPTADEAAPDEDRGGSSPQPKLATIIDAPLDKANKRIAAGGFQLPGWIQLTVAILTIIQLIDALLPRWGPKIFGENFFKLDLWLTVALVVVNVPFVFTLMALKIWKKYYKDGKSKHRTILELYAFLKDLALPIGLIAIILFTLHKDYTVPKFAKAKSPEVSLASHSTFIPTIALYKYVANSDDKRLITHAVPIVINSDKAFIAKVITKVGEADSVKFRGFIEKTPMKPGAPQDSFLLKLPKANGFWKERTQGEILTIDFSISDTLSGFTQKYSIRAKVEILEILKPPPQPPPNISEECLQKINAAKEKLSGNNNWNVSMIIPLFRDKHCQWWEDHELVDAFKNRFKSFLMNASQTARNQAYELLGQTSNRHVAEILQTISQDRSLTSMQSELNRTVQRLHEQLQRIRE